MTSNETPQPTAAEPTWAERATQLLGLNETVENAIAARDLAAKPFEEALVDLGQVNRDHQLDLRIPCGTDRRIGWRFDGADSTELWFTHDCRHHGYDLDETEYLHVPLRYFTNRDAWIAETAAAARAHRESESQEKDDRERAARRAAYEALRAEFEPTQG